MNYCLRIFRGLMKHSPINFSFFCELRLLMLQNLPQSSCLTLVLASYCVVSDRFQFILLVLYIMSITTF